MNKHTDEAIEKFLREVFKADFYYDEKMTSLKVDPPDLLVLENKDDCVRLKIARMYNSPQVGLTQLLKISTFFGTTNIHDARFSREGCESCDHGSEYGAELTIRPEKID